VFLSNCICAGIAPHVQNTNELTNLGLAKVKTTLPRQKMIDISNMKYKNTMQTHKLFPLHHANYSAAHLIPTNNMPTLECAQ
jgi:hypothetical protein